VSSLVSPKDQSARDLAARDADFGSDPIVVLLHGSGPDGIVLDPAALTAQTRLEGALAKFDNVAVVYGPGTVLNQTAAAMQNVLLTISGRRDALQSRARILAKKAGAGRAGQDAAARRAVVAFDRRYGTLLASALPMGLPTLSNQRFVASVLFDERGDPKPAWRFLVPDADSAAILVRPRTGLDRAATSDLVAKVRSTIRAEGPPADRVTVTGVPVLTADLGRQAVTEAPQIGALALGLVGLVLLGTAWTRRRHRLLPLAAAGLGSLWTIGVLGWSGHSVSVGAVAFLPMLLGIGSDFPLYLLQALPSRRIVLAAVASVAALATLAFSPVPFVREFGLALALGLTLTCAGAWCLRTIVGPLEPAPSKAREATERLVGPFVGGRVARSATPVSVRVLAGAGVVGVLAAAGGWVGLQHLTIASSPEDLAAGAPGLAEVARARDALGFSNEVSVVVKGPDVLSPAALGWATDAESAVVRDAGDVAHPLLTVGGLLRSVSRGATQQEIDAAVDLLPSYLVNAVVAPDRGSALLTFGIEPADVAGQQLLLRRIDAVLPKTPPAYSATVTGLPVVAADSLQQLEGTRWSGSLVALGVAAPVVALGGLRRAVLVLTSGLLTTGWILALLTVTGQPLSPLTLPVGALVAITASEFTTALSHVDPVARARMRRTALTAASAGVLGYLSLAFSNLAMLRDFGLLVAVAVAFSFLASALVTASDRALRRRDDQEPGSELESVRSSAPDLEAVR